MAFRGSHHTMTDPLQVVFAANRAYVPYVSAAITSVRHNLDPAVVLKVTILSRDIEPTDIGWPNRRAGDSLLCFSPEIHRDVLPIRPNDHLTVETYFRLFLEKAFDASVKRVVYLDADLVVLGDLSRVAAIDLGGKTLGAVLDIHVRRWGKAGAALRGGTTDDRPYFNAGVLIIDLDAWRKRHVRQRALTFLHEHTDGILFWDQDALNAVLVDDWIELDPRWNRMSHYWEQRKTGTLPFSQETIASLRDPFIVHFASGSKPWHGFRHPDRAAFDTYAIMAGFGSHRMTFFKALKEKGRKMLSAGLGTFARSAPKG
jgi:lipopolysaccharide biosynthesis glycosyltransferase